MAKAEQGMLIDTSHPGHKPIKAAAKKYRNARDERMAAMKPEREAKQRLIDLMNEHNLETFVIDDDTTVELVPGKVGVKVRTSKDDDDLEELEKQDEADGK